MGIVSQASAAAAAPASLPPISATPGHRISQALAPKLSKQSTISASGSNSPIYYYNWSGYAATATTPFVAAQSTFTQPAVSCPVAGAWTLFWVGFDGFNNNTVEQAGTAAQCGSGTNPQPTYYAWWEMYPTNTIQMMPITIKVGDNIQATVSYTASNAQYSLGVSDLTNKAHYTQMAYCAPGLTCDRQSAESIVERPSVGGVYTPLAKWGTMTLSNNKAANTYTTNRHTHVISPVLQPLSAFSNTPVAMVNYPYTGAILANVSGLDSTGTQFSDTWQAAQ
jgi:hypothetical protein